MLQNASRRLTRLPVARDALRAGRRVVGYVGSHLAPARQHASPSAHHRRWSSTATHSPDTSTVTSPSSSQPPKPNPRGSGIEKGTVFDETLPKLTDALKEGDITTIADLWSLLDQNSLLPLLDSSLHSRFSVFVRDAISHPSHSSLKPLQWQILDEIAVFTCAYGDKRGLQARMLYHIGDSNPDAAIELFSRLDSLVRRRASIDNPDLSPTIACLAVIAFVMKDSFVLAIRTIDSSASLLTASVVRTFFSNEDLPLSLELRTKAKIYAHRLATAGVINRPSVLQRHVSNLADSSNDHSLAQLYHNISSGLFGPEPWLTVDPSTVSDATPVLLPDFTWAILLKAFLECNRLDMAERLWDDMTKAGVQPTMDTWTSLLEGYADLNLVDRVLAVWSILLRERTRPGVMAHRAVIRALFKARHVDEALQQFYTLQDLLKKNELPYDESTVLMAYNTTLSYALSSHREPEAQSIFEQMRETGPKPDAVTYNTFMHHHRIKGQPGAIGTMLQEMETAGVAPDVVTYSTILSALLPVNENAAVTVLDLMAKRGVSLTATTCTSIIDHLLKQDSPRSLQGAFNFLRIMETSASPDMHPNSITYTVLLCGIHRRSRELGPARTEEYIGLITDKMAKRRIVPTKGSYNILIRTCLESQHPNGVEHAMRYYKEMPRNRVPIEDSTRFILLRGLLHRKEWDVADTVVEGLRDKKPLSDSVVNLITQIRQRTPVQRHTRRTVR
ncbi:hypothetical protein PHLGIDRAFT_259980 [Phlebiopsis gigantea 11061_1 CR5-6]|uniref:Pentacotripeptide-repeat region of PRORP domain-containing protein n=1 Tax=Phlebiopsis gigantea (strain 11061_1 CR5-6) TaxID=745531 RepID=A0A0C3SFQ4_PHLG1|nr:hypothetical protein PHLGIDRAFT_259980 [Phlebiopsis gigantea 11061_1 CR5-6]